MCARLMIGQWLFAFLRGLLWTESMYGRVNPEWLGHFLRLFLGRRGEAATKGGALDFRTSR